MPRIDGFLQMLTVQVTGGVSLRKCTIFPPITPNNASKKGFGLFIIRKSLEGRFWFTFSHIERAALIPLQFFITLHVYTTSLGLSCQLEERRQMRFEATYYILSLPWREVFASHDVLKHNYPPLYFGIHTSRQPEKRIVRLCTVATTHFVLVHAEYLPVDGI